MRARRSILGRRLTGSRWWGRVFPAIALGLIFAAAALPAVAQDKKDRAGLFPTRNSRPTNC